MGMFANNITFLGDLFDTDLLNTETCRINDYIAGKICASKVKVPLLDVHIGFAIQKCPNSMMPQLAFHCVGPQCKKLAKPCNSNADCGSANNEIACESIPYFQESINFGLSFVSVRLQLFMPRTLQDFKDIKIPVSQTKSFPMS